MLWTLYVELQAESFFQKFLQANYLYFSRSVHGVQEVDVMAATVFGNLQLSNISIFNAVKVTPRYNVLVEIPTDYPTKVIEGMIKAFGL